MIDYIVGDRFYTYTAGMYPKIVPVILLSRDFSGARTLLKFERYITIYEDVLDVQLVFTTKELAKEGAIEHTERQKGHYKGKIDALQNKIDRIDKHIKDKLK